MQNLKTKGSIQLPFILSAALALASALAHFPIAAHAAESASPPSTQQSYEEEIRQTKALIDAGNLTEGQLRALSAIGMNPERPEGYYYAGLSYLLQNEFDTGSRLMDLAFDKANDDPAVEVNRTLIQATRSRFLGHGEHDLHVKKAEEALSSRLRGKAAREYLLAWKAWPQNASTGLKAASLHLEIEDIANAAKIAYGSLQTQDPVGDLTPLRQLVSTHRAKFEAAGNEFLLQGAKLIRRDPQAARGLLIESMAIFPEKYKVYFYLAWLALHEGRTEETERYFLKMAEAGAEWQEVFNDGVLRKEKDRPKLQEVLSLREIIGLPGLPLIQNQISDIWGPILQAKINQAITRIPSNTITKPLEDYLDQTDAEEACHEKGMRLPTIEELAIILNPRGFSAEQRTGSREFQTLQKEVFHYDSSKYTGAELHEGARFRSKSSQLESDEEVFLTFDSESGEIESFRSDSAEAVVCYRFP